MRDPIDGIERKLDNIDDRVNDLVKVNKDLEQSLDNIAYQCECLVTLLGAYMPVAISAFQLANGQITEEVMKRQVEDCRRFLEQRPRIK